MAVGFVLIDSKPGSEREVYASLGEIKEIVEAHPLFGEYDILAKVEVDGPNIENLSPVVMKIRGIPYVIDTKTLPGCGMKKAEPAPQDTTEELLEIIRKGIKPPDGVEFTRTSRKDAYE